MAVRHRSPRRLGRRCVVARGHHRAAGQQITGGNRGGTMMRHFFSARRPQAAHPGGMLLSTARTRLVAPAGLPDILASGLPGTAAVTVDLPAVAAAANNHFAPARPAQEQTARPRLALRIVADEAWTNATLGRILAPHSCPSRCGARRRDRTVRLPFGAVLARKSGRLPPAGRGARCLGYPPRQPRQDRSRS